MKKDPITAPASNASGNPKNANAGRLKSYKGAGAAFTDPKPNTFPAPSNPYK